MIFFIPARKGSKGFPFKNRKFIHYTLRLLYDSNINKKDIVVSTDDEYIINICQTYVIPYDVRKENLSDDKVSIKSVLKDYIERNNIDDDICLLYLTYPYRTKTDFENIINNYKDKKSLLCLQPVLTHPYLTMKKENGKWEQSIKHNLYRRQDYPETKEITHYMCIFNSNNIDELNENMYGDITYWYELGERVKDIDYEKDMI